MSRLIDVTSARSQIRNTYQWVQVHVHVNEIWCGRDHQQRITDESVKRTIEVGAIGVDGRDLGDSDIDSGRQGVLVRHRVEALRQRRQNPKANRFP
jgi:hypothetical protein